MTIAETDLTTAMAQRLALRQHWDAVRNRDLFALLVLTVPRLLSAERVSVFVRDPERNSIWLEAGTGVVQRQIVVADADSMVGRVMASGEVLRASGLAQAAGVHQQLVQSTGFVTHSALTVPVFNRQGEAVIAALQVLNKAAAQGDLGFDDDDVALLEQIAFAVQPSLEEVFARQDLVRQAEALDRQIAVLQARDSAIRPGHMMRTFAPLQTLGSAGFAHHRYQTTTYPPFIDLGSAGVLRDTWDTSPQDVLICTHQKVGTHLAKKFLVELLQRSHDLPAQHPCRDGDIGHGAVPWPEVMLSQQGETAWQDFLASTGVAPRLWYLHCGYGDLPVRRIHPQTRFVMVIRDPKAVAVSQYHFWQKHPLLGVDPSFDLDSFVDLFLGDDLYFGNYHRHVLGWLDRADQRLDLQQLCLLYYEDMVENKRQVARQLQGVLPGSGPLDDQQIEALVAATGFDAMKREMTDNPRSFHLNPTVYFRAGTTDSWRQELSERAAERIDAATDQLWGASPVRAQLERYLSA
ncbi:MAG: GAF domain-containing protein [Cyanobacteria bacterium K_DeepCast_35m_m2_023]|nr:GAF domain-containing protein [Cyanobacteria bacterium K_DeepCast_35m_m2_023]